MKPMVYDKGKKYFTSEFIKKLKNGHNNDDLQLSLKNTDPKDLVDCYGRSVLHKAVSAKNIGMVEYFIEKGFEINAMDNDMKTPLRYAVIDGDERMIQVLLAAKADLFLCDKNGWNPVKVGFTLGYAGAVIDYSGIVKMMVEAMKEKYSNNVKKIAKILLGIENSFPRTILFNNTALTKYMLSKGCTVDDKDSLDQTALHYAVECGDLENLKLLLQHGANVYTKNWYRETPLHLYKFGSEENSEILKCMLEHTAYTGACSESGSTVTTQVFQYGKVESVKVLLDHGVDICELHEGTTLLQYLVQNENPDVIKLLRDKNFDIDVRDIVEETALFTAADYGNVHAVKFLLKKGANPNILSKGSSIFSSVIGMRCNSYDIDRKLRKYLTCIELLLDHGAAITRDLFHNVQHISFLRPIIAKVAMMKVLNQKVRKKMLSKIESQEVFKKYFDVCERKMEKIKGTVIRDKVMLSTFLVEPEEKLLMYARNQESRVKLERFLRRESSSDLYFVKILRQRIERILQIIKLREEAAIVICKITECSNHEVIDKIVLFLDKDSLENLCQVCNCSL